MTTLLEIAAPTIEYRLLGPVLIVFVGACLGVLIEGLVPRHLRDEGQLIVTGVSLAAALVVLWRTWGPEWRTVGAMGALSVDGPTQMIWLLILVFALLSALLFAERRLGSGVTSFTPMAAAVPNSTLERDAAAARVEHTEVFPLLLFAVTGMLLFPAANDLLTMFVALEILSLPLYLLSGLARYRRLLSHEAALKYFLLGALSSAIFLFGAALLYGYSGSFTFAAIDAAIASPSEHDTLLVTGMVLLMVGLLFKLGAVPFHSWTPDVYQGAPTPVTAFMAVCTKLAAIGALLRLLFVALGGSRWEWQPVVAGISVLTMLVGAVLAIVSKDIKRLLAYSSVTHAGFLLTAVVGASTATTGLPVGQVGSAAAIVVYMAAYGFATLGAFGIVMMVRGLAGERNDLAAWQGIGRGHPWIGGAMTLFMLSFAGIPPTAGFIGKWAVFSAAWRGGYWWLVLVAVLLSLVAAYFYLRVVAIMFFTEPDPALKDVHVAMPGLGTTAVIAVGAVMSVLLGILPGWVVDLAASASQLLR
ncbi:MAG: NADH-quinone oxidoreductase subunit NuoN [Propionibacteriaceae bacterium]